MKEQPRRPRALTVVIAMGIGIGAPVLFAMCLGVLALHLSGALGLPPGLVFVGLVGPIGFVAALVAIVRRGSGVHEPHWSDAYSTMRRRGKPAADGNDESTERQ